MPVGMCVRRTAESVLLDRKSTRLNSSHLVISYAVFCLKKKKNNFPPRQSSCACALLLLLSRPISVTSYRRLPASCRTDVDSFLFLFGHSRYHFSTTHSS